MRANPVPIDSVPDNLEVDITHIALPCGKKTMVSLEDDRNTSFNIPIYNVGLAGYGTVHVERRSYLTGDDRSGGSQHSSD